ncbi:hypothetical protein FRC01_000683, partial [Tulasnella sp. 417]
QDEELPPYHSLKVLWRKLVAKQFPSRRGKAPPLASLPTEILIVTIGYLELRDKVSVAQTSRYFRSLVESILYRRIFLDEDEVRRDPLRTPLLYRTLGKRQDLLLHLISYHGPLVPYRTAPEWIEASPPRTKLTWVKPRRTQRPWPKDLSYEERFEISKKIFCGAKNIMELHFTDWAGMGYEKLWNAFDAAKSNQNIESLILSGGGVSPYLVSILRKQPRLKNLDLIGDARVQLQELQNTDLPELLSLKSSLQDAAMIVPGRPIKNLELSYYYPAYQYPREKPDEESLFRQLSLSACDITTFTIRFQRSWHEEVIGGVLRLIARYLPKIERLCLSILGGVPGSLILEELLPLTSLRHLTLIGSIVKEEGYDAELQEDQLPDGTILYTRHDFASFVRLLKQQSTALVEVEWCRSERHKNPKLKTIQGWAASQPVVQLLLGVKESTLQRQKAVGITSLPYEIITFIIESLEERGKARMVRTCRYFKNLVEPILYRHIKIDFNLETYGQAMLKTYLLHNTLKARPDLLPGILSYYGPVVPNVMELQQTLKEDGHRIKTFWFRLRNAGSFSRTLHTQDQCIQNSKSIFSRMVSMQDLEFTDMIGPWTWEWASELWDTFATTKSNQNLEKLALRVHGDFPYLMSIFRAQPRLKHLGSLRSAGTQVKGLQSTDLQELQSFKGTLSEAAIFVPGRPVTRLELLYYEVSPSFMDQQPNPVEAHYKNLALSTCGITDFTVRFLNSWSDDVSEKNFQFIVRYLPKIERLCIMTLGMLPEDIKNQKVKPVHSYIRSWTASLPAVWRKTAVKRSPLALQKTSKLAFLPDDTLIPIIECLDEMGKAHLIQTCRYFRELVEPTLYHCIILDYHTEREYPLKSHLLHDTLSERQDLLPFIVVYHGPLVPNVMALQQVMAKDEGMKKTRWSRFRTTTNHPAYRKLLTYEERFEMAKSIFNGAINMRELHFTDFVDWFSRQLWDPFDAIKSSMKLEKMVLHIGGDSPYLVPILRAQPKLKDLELLRGRRGPVQKLHSTDLPELRSLKGTLAEAAGIVPGRPVEKLALIFSPARDEDHEESLFNEKHLKQLALSTCGISNLTIRFHRACTDQVIERNLRLVAQYLPKVERLCLFVWSGVSDNLLFGTLPAFGSLQSLKVVGVVIKEEIQGTIVGENRIQRSLYETDDFADLLRTLKEGCPSLTGLEWYKREKYHCCMEQVC